MSPHTPTLLGPGERWAILAALCYAATNLFLRAVAVTADPIIAAILRLAPVTLLAWSLTFWTRLDTQLNPRGRGFAGWRILRLLLLSGAASYFIGNNAYQLALRFGGINVTVPVAQSASLWGGIVLGSIFLQEHFKRDVVWGGSAVAIGLLLLTLGQGGQVLAEWYLAIPLAATAGLGYALANLLMRTGFRRGMAQFPALAVNATGGMLLLLITVVLRDGLNFLAATPTPVVFSLLAAGVFNAGALFSLSRALTLTTSARVNSINTGTIAISALLAALLFHEPLTLATAAGIALIIGGILFVQRYLAPAQPRPVPSTPRMLYLNT
ncbi:MAG TPA: DMT family transporter [Anaerolineae bacterium]|nr:DMT family transporter [Anaerolineae bacterium]